MRSDPLSGTPLIRDQSDLPNTCGTDQLRAILHVNKDKWKADVASASPVYNHRRSPTEG